MSRPEQLLTRARAASPLLDRVVRAVLHYRARQGSTLAAAVTYFAFLSFFPVLALAFAAVGFVSAVYPEARTALVQGLQLLLPGMVATAPGSCRSPRSRPRQARSPAWAASPSSTPG